ncbi:MAG: hypothetical protein IT210_04415 [Armatimonadetes bacterium]|nr:hypothetical protein [Armatimonadota bacterium]
MDSSPLVSVSKGIDRALPSGLSLSRFAERWRGGGTLPKPEGRGRSTARYFLPQR